LFFQGVQSKTAAMSLASERSEGGAQQPTHFDGFEGQRIGSISEDMVPPTMVGHLLKVSPNRLRQCICSYQLRHVVLERGYLTWAMPTMLTDRGGPLQARGCLNFHKNPCEVRVDRGITFTVRPLGGGWQDGTFTGVHEGRIFTFDTQGSEHNLQRWMEAFKAHIAYATACRMAQVPVARTSSIGDVMSSHRETQVSSVASEAASNYNSEPEVASMPSRRHSSMLRKEPRPLDVTIVSARGLRAADMWPGKSDPYCLVEVLGRSVADAEKPKTEVINNTIEPAWNYRFEMPECTFGDVLVFKVYDSDFSKQDDFLGSATLEVCKLDQSGFEDELRLDGAGRGIEAFLKLKVSQLAPAVNPASGVGSTDRESQRSRVASEPLGRLRITVVAARGLRAADMWPGKSDPYCVCEVLGRAAPKIQTRVHKNTITPVWDHEFTMDEFSTSDVFVFKVYDSDDYKHDDFLGSATLAGHQIGRNGFDGELKLQSAGGEAYLTIRVAILEF